MSEPQDEARAAREAAAVLREACEAGAALGGLVKEHASTRRASLHLDLSAAHASLHLLRAATSAPPLGAAAPAPPSEALLCVTGVGARSGGGSSGAAASDAPGAAGAADEGGITPGLELVLDRRQPPTRALRLRLHGVGVSDAACGAPPPLRTLLGPHLPRVEQSAPAAAAAPLHPTRFDLEVASSPADGARYAVALSHAAMLARPEVVGTFNPLAHNPHLQPSCPQPSPPTSRPQPSPPTISPTTLTSTLTPTPIGHSYRPRPWLGLGLGLA